MDDFRRENPANEFPQDLQDSVKENWDAQLNGHNPGQTDDVAAIIFKMGTAGRFTKKSFKNARDERAEKVRELDSSLGEEYYKTPHKHCITNLGYTRNNSDRRDPMQDFIDEAERVWREYQRENSE